MEFSAKGNKIQIAGVSFIEYLASMHPTNEAYFKVTLVLLKFGPHQNESAGAGVIHVTYDNCRYAILQNIKTNFKFRVFRRKNWKMQNRLNALSKSKE